VWPLSLARSWLEEVLHPITPLGQSAPQGICAHLAFDELLPEHALGNDAQPFLADQLGRFERFGIQVRQNVFCDVIQTLDCK